MNAMHGRRPHEAQPEAVALFVSDVHLQSDMPHTAAAFLAFLARQAPHAQAVYLLGDLFEYWAGDDDLSDPFHVTIVDALRALSVSGTSLFWLPGNRDFLVAEGFAKAARLQLLHEPYVLQQAATRIALVHGDAQCTDDAAYMAFRAQVRQPAWQAGFLGMPLAQRKKIIAGMRNDSKNAQREKTMQIMDVNQDAVITLFEGTGADVIIHGHTHRPARHALEHGTRTVSRLVLPDWDCEAEPAHGGWIRLESDGSLHRYDVRGNVVDWSSR